MNDNIYDFKERQTFPNGSSNLSKNKLTKSYTSFHPKKTLSKKKSNKNPLKNNEYLNQKKYSKTKRIHFSDKKEKNLDYLEINPLSPQNKFSDINSNHLYMNNLPSSDRCLNKYNKRYVFDNIKKYRANMIMDYNLKTYTNEENKNREKNIIKENSISDNISDNNNKNTNRASSNNNNNIALNNSLIHSSENFLNTIAMTLTNNNNETNIQSNRVKFCGLNNIGIRWSTNKSVNNLKDFSTNSKSKILNKFKKRNNKINKNEKEMNNLKNKNLNSIKKTVIFKTKSKTKIKPSHHIYSKENKKNSSKKCYKSSTNIANGIVTNAKINSNNIKQTDNNNLPLDETDKTKMNEESNNNSYKNINDKDLLYQTVENNRFNGDIINNNFNFLNIINTSNKRNNDSQKEGLTTIKTLNTMKSYQQSVNVSNNMNLENHNNIINNNINIIENNIIQNIESKNDIAFQTYNGSFRQNIIKVNILDKAKILNKKIESIKSSIIDNDTINSNDQKTLVKNNKGTKSANNLMENISNSNIIIENDKINLYITTEIHNNNKKSKINLKNNIINKFNKNTLDQSNKYKNITITNHSPKKKDFKLNKQKTEYNKNIKSNNKQNKLINSLNYSQTNYKSNKTNAASISNISNTLNFNLYPLNRTKTLGYIKKKSSNSNLNDQSSNGNPNLTSNTNRSSVYKHKKNNSISSSIYNTQRTINQNRLNLKSKNSKNKKKNNLYSSPENKIEIYQENKSILVPEYTIKLENIKSRVTNLLNIYSLLALKSINDFNNKEIEEKEEAEINENEK